MKNVSKVSIATRSTPVHLGHAVLYLCPFKDKHFWFQIFKTWISCAKIKLYKILRGYIVNVNSYILSWVVLVKYSSTTSTWLVMLYRVGLWIRVLANRNNCERCIEHNSYTTLKKTSKIAKIWARKKPYYSRPSISKTSVHHYIVSLVNSFWVFEKFENMP